MLPPCPKKNTSISFGVSIGEHISGSIAKCTGSTDNAPNSFILLLDPSEVIKNESYSVRSAPV